MCRLRITIDLRSGAVDKMAGVFTKRIWQPCICQPNELNREIKKKTGECKRGAKQKSGGSMAHPKPPLESSLHPLALENYVRLEPTTGHEFLYVWIILLLQIAPQLFLRLIIRNSCSCVPMKYSRLVMCAVDLRKSCVSSITLKQMIALQLKHTELHMELEGAQAVR